MSAGGNIAQKVGWWWVVPTLALSVVGASATAADWSELFSNGVGTTAGIIVEDAPNLGSSFKEGQAAAGGSAPAPAPQATEAAEPQTAAPAEQAD